MLVKTTKIFRVPFVRMLTPSGCITYALDLFAAGFRGMALAFRNSICIRSPAVVSQGLCGNMVSRDVRCIAEILVSVLLDIADIVCFGHGWRQASHPASPPLLFTL